jgi:hypothetical protein
MRCKKSAEVIVQDYCNNPGRTELIRARSSYINLGDVE